MLARICSSSPVRWVNLPTPVTAYEMLPGSFFACAISSGKLLMLSLGLIPIDCGCTAVIPMGVKSRGSLRGRLGALPGIVRNTDKAGAYIV